MAVFLTGLGIALFLLTIQWYVEKKADEEEARNEEVRETRQRRARARKRSR